MTGIHPLAHVDPTAEIGEGTTIGPFAYVAPGTKIGSDNEIRAHAIIEGPGTEVGDRNVVWGGAVVGGAPQDKKYRGEPTRAVIGDDNLFREHVTVHRGTGEGGGVTRIGDRNLLFAGAHVAHDCEVRSDVVLANQVLLAGHVRVEDRAIMNGSSGMHQFGTVRTLSYIGGYSRLVRDAPPFMVTEGNPARTAKVNVVGLRRCGFSEDRIDTMRTAFRYVFRRRHSTWVESFEALRTDGVWSDDVERLRQFFEAMSHGKQGRALEGTRA